MLKNFESVEEINNFNSETLMEHLNIEITEVGDRSIKATMPVDKRTRQPHGMLHGGASVAFIESVGSIGSSLMIDLNREIPVGIEVNANHVRAVKEGVVIANGILRHIGKKTHVWQVDITEEKSEKLICTGRLTVMIVQKEE